MCSETKEKNVDWQVKLEEVARENPMINEIQNDEKGAWRFFIYVLKHWSVKIFFHQICHMNQTKLMLCKLRN